MAIFDLPGLGPNKPQKVFLTTLNDKFGQFGVDIIFDSRPKIFEFLTYLGLGRPQEGPGKAHIGN